MTEGLSIVKGGLQSKSGIPMELARGADGKLIIREVANREITAPFFPFTPNPLQYAQQLGCPTCPADCEVRDVLDSVTHKKTGEVNIEDLAARNRRYHLSREPQHRSGPGNCGADKVS
jgi:hypothetical protein